MKFFINTKKMLAVIIGFGMLIVASTVMAVPITGGVNFVGVVNLTDSDGDPTTIPSTSTATGIHFLSGMTLGGVSGDYVGVPNGTSVAFQDITFSPILSPDPVEPLWTLTSGGLTYDFNMTGVVPSVGPNSLTLNGAGTLGITGFDDTPGYWRLTTQDGETLDLTFSSSSGAVPEPATLLLLGTGLVGIGFFGKRKNELA